MSSARTSLPPKARRRRSIQQRQTTIIGGLVAALLLIALLSAAIWAQLLPMPFDRSFTADPESASDGASTNAATPCPPDGATPRALNEITANVYNSTDVQGLASETQQSLAAVGVVVNQSGNSGGSAYEGGARITAGANGVIPAYSLARIFPMSEIIMDDRTDESVDVVLGTGFSGISSEEEIAALDPNAPLEPVEGCTPIEPLPEPAAG